jgi:hypothetical protein
MEGSIVVQEEKFITTICTGPCACEIPTENPGAFLLFEW